MGHARKERPLGVVGLLGSQQRVAENPLLLGQLALVRQIHNVPLQFLVDQHRINPHLEVPQLRVFVELQIQLRRLAQPPVLIQLGHRLPGRLGHNLL